MKGRRPQACLHPVFGLKYFMTQKTVPNTLAAFHVMIQPKGAVCNLDCQYCYFLSKEKLYPDSSFHMQEDLLEMYTRQYIGAQQVPQATFAWQGGEPTLMGLDFFKKAVAFQQKHKKPGMRILNTIQTNGTLLDEEWCQFFKEHNFLVGISIDGPENLHNAYRKDKGGKPTFQAVMKGWKLLKKHNVDVNVLVTVNTVNSIHPKDVYRFLRDEAGAQFIQFIPIVERKNRTGYQEGHKVTDRSVTAKQYGDFLIGVFDEWIRWDVASVFVQLFDVALAAWVGQQPGLCIFAETCGTALALEHNGDLYACDHFVEPRYKIGNIREKELSQLAASPRQFRFGQDKKKKLPRYCRRCDVRFVCNGGCPKNRFIKSPEREPGLNYLCEGYKAFFHYIDKPMRIMTNLIKERRPPADVMFILASENR